MSTSFHRNMIVQDIVKDHPHQAKVLHRLGIDPNDTGTLTQAAHDKGLSVEFLLTVLDKTAAMTDTIGQGADQNFQRIFLGIIIEYIIQRHHVFLKTELPLLEQLFDEVIETHHSSHGKMLEELKTAFVSFKANIEEHLAIEEEVFFRDYAILNGQIRAKNYLKKFPGDHRPSVQLRR